MTKHCRNDAPGMVGCRSRNPEGQLRKKRGDTLVGTIEKKYNVDLGVNTNMRLDTLLKKKGVSSLDNLLNGK